MGSVVAAVGFFLSTFLWDLPFLKRRNDSRKDFLKDFRRDIGLSSALAMSGKKPSCLELSGFLVSFMLWPIKTVCYQDGSIRWGVRCHGVYNCISYVKTCTYTLREICKTLYDFLKTVRNCPNKSLILPCAFKVHFAKIVIFWKQSRMTSPWAVPAATRPQSRLNPMELILAGGEIWNK